MARRLALGLDLSTQSATASVVDVDDPSRAVLSPPPSVHYLDDPRLAGRFALGGDFVLPPREPGDACQPCALFAAALDALLGDVASGLRRLGRHPSEVVAVSVSAQQHAHVWLARGAQKCFEALNKPQESKDLEALLADAWSTPLVRIWRTSCTKDDADAMIQRLQAAGENVIELSGSNAPLRFSAFGIRRTARSEPEVYRNTVLIHQLSSCVTAVLIGHCDAPLGTTDKIDHFALAEARTRL
eukprot:TRINITY_DN3238_c0_g1_i2.p1 TRINITY_DN3238_c0_g1~~TRINITY_DN3238_c0_g1_i2.p1  ORF type:complete len:243 (-),score=53.07 TRINITY_DN3238_c0_g1_i2:54-782(-)